MSRSSIITPEERDQALFSIKQVLLTAREAAGVAGDPAMALFDGYALAALTMVASSLGLQVDMTGYPYPKKED